MSQRFPVLEEVKDEAPRMTSRAIKDILGKEEMTVWDVGILLKAAGQMAQDLPGAVFNRSLECAQHDAQRMMEAARTHLGHAQETLAEVERIEEKLIERTDKLFAARRDIQKKLGALPELSLPSMYQIEQAVKLCEQLAGMDERTWGRLLDLARAIHGREKRDQ